MTIAELVINCLKETFRNDDTAITVANLQDGALLNTPEYANQVNNVFLSINKAISRLITAKKIELKHDVLTANEDTCVYDISSISDIRMIRSIYTIDQYGRRNWIGWSYVGQNLIFLGYGLTDTIHIVYERKIPNFTEDDLDSDTDIETEYGLTDELCNYINYFAKSELFEESDPDRCKRYLNYFEQFIAEVDNKTTITYQQAVQAKYKIR